MIASMLKRLHILQAKLNNNELIKHCSWADVLHEMFKFYSWHTRAVKNRMQITKNDAVTQVDIDGTTIYWPGDADTDRLCTMYFEVFNKHNNHFFDIPEMEIKHGDVVVDCGACEGYFTHKALQSGAQKVHCIEPAQDIVSCLEKTFADEICADRVSIHSCLVGSRSAVVDFCQNPADPTTGHVDIGEQTHENGPVMSLTKTEMITIDDLFNHPETEKLDFIKADVEGSEVDLIYGAEETIRRFKPALAIAVYHAPENANLIVNFIDKLSLNYRIKVKGIVDFNAVPRPVMVHCYH